MATPEELAQIPEELLTEEERKKRAKKLTQEIAHKYDPERLARVVVDQAGRGEHLDAGLQSEMESRIGGNFGSVRVFRGPFAEAVTKQHRADAVTVGATGMILVREGPRSDPHTALGKALLAHELTHVAQAQKGLHFALEGGEGQHAAHEQAAEKVESEVHDEASGGGGGGGTGGGVGPAVRQARRAGKMVMRRRCFELLFEEERLACGTRAPGSPTLRTQATMSDTVESPERLQHLARDRALRNHTYRDFSAPRLRVERGDFSGSTFERLTLGEAELDGVDLSQTTLRRVDLRGARLSGALLARTSLTDCDLTEVVLAGAQIERIEMVSTQLGNLDLDEAKLVHCRFVGCNLYGVKLRRAVVIKCSFASPLASAPPELTRAQLGGATLVDCDPARRQPVQRGSARRAVRALPAADRQLERRAGRRRALHRLRPDRLICADGSARPRT